MKTKLISFGTLAALATIFLFAFPGLIASGYSNSNATPSTLPPGVSTHFTYTPPSQVHTNAVNCAVKPFCSYVTDFGTNVVTVVQGGKVVSTISVCGETGSAAYDPANHLVYVGDWACGEVDVINATNQQLVTSITGLPYPFAATYSTKSHMIYVTEFGSQEVTVINPKTNTVKTEITTCGLYPEFIDQLNKGDVYVVSRDNPNNGNGCIDQINPKTNTVVNSVTFSSPYTVGVSVNQANKEVYVMDYGFLEAYVLNSTNLNSITTISGLGSAWGSFYNSGTREVYVAEYANAAVLPITTSNTLGTAITLNGGSSSPNSGCSAKGTSYVPAYGYSVVSVVKKDKNTANPAAGTNPFSCGGT